MKRTLWFSAGQYKPVRVGWYELKTKWGAESNVWRWYWDGEDWRWSPGGMHIIKVWPSDMWRGLTREWK
jgi:hypothetical protein